MPDRSHSLCIHINMRPFLLWAFPFIIEVDASYIYFFLNGNECVQLSSFPERSRSIVKKALRTARTNCCIWVLKSKIEFCRSVICHVMIKEKPGRGTQIRWLRACHCGPNRRPSSTTVCINVNLMTASIELFSVWFTGKRTRVRTAGVKFSC